MMKVQTNPTDIWTKTVTFFPKISSFVYFAILENNKYCLFPNFTVIVWLVALAIAAPMWFVQKVEVNMQS